MGNDHISERRSNRKKRKEPIKMFKKSLLILFALILTLGGYARACESHGVLVAQSAQCDYCGHTFRENEEYYRLNNGKNCCQSCYRKMQELKCQDCGTTISTKINGYNLCAPCYKKRTAVYCEGCGKEKGEWEGFYNYKGKKLCKSCLDGTVVGNCCYCGGSIRYGDSNIYKYGDGRIFHGACQKKN